MAKISGKSRKVDSWGDHILSVKILIATFILAEDET